MCFLLSFVPVFIAAQVTTPRMDMTLAELQEMAARQQQQIEAQQQLLASKVHKEEVQDERGDVWIQGMKRLSGGDESKSQTRRDKIKSKIKERVIGRKWRDGTCCRGTKTSLVHLWK